MSRRPKVQRIQRISVGPPSVCLISEDCLQYTCEFLNIAEIHRTARTSRFFNRCCKSTYKRIRYVSLTWFRDNVKRKVLASVLLKCPNMTDFEVESCNFVDFTAIVRTLPNLEYLTIQADSWDEDEQIQAIPLIARHLRRVKGLALFELDKLPVINITPLSRLDLRLLWIASKSIVARIRGLDVLLESCPLDNLYFMNMDCDFEKEFRKVRDLPPFERLGLENCDLTDSFLSIIARRLPNIKQLFLIDSPKLTDNGLQVLARLKKIEALALDLAFSSQNTLQMLCRKDVLPYLKLLDICDGRSVSMLKDARPDCTVCLRPAVDVDE